MSNFKDLKEAIQAQFAKMKEGNLFRTGIDRDVIWDTYLKAFPEGTNPIFRERTEHDCSCCKQFIRAAGDMVAIVDNKKVSIWDIDIEGPYQVVADTLSELVKAGKIDNVFIHRELFVGTDFNLELEEESTLRWDHFYISLPAKHVRTGDDVGTTKSNALASKEVFERSLKEITTEAIETVIELNDQGSLYRGAEHNGTIMMLQTCKDDYDSIENEEEKDNYCWDTSVTLGMAARVRNTVIGTLLTDISEGVELEKAVDAFGNKMDPLNYKRPTALITQSMIRNAEKKVAELGFEYSLQRRYARAEDFTINNVLFADRTTRKAMNVFDEMAEDVPVNIKELKRVDEIDIDTFLETVLPKIDNIELLFENKHGNNLMSLISPVHEDAKNMFKWGNNFSWAYNGEAADSIKEKVKRAGGNVNGILRASLSWFNFDDLDIHVIEPGGNHISYTDKESYVSDGKLDVDMNVDNNGSRQAVENVVWTDQARMKEGIYEVFIHNYAQRENIDIGFDVEIEFAGTIHTFHYDKKVVNKVVVAKFEYSHNDGIKFIESLPSTHKSKEIWGIPTQKFQKVSMIMNSPNYWDGESTGNKHFFFILEGCKNDSRARGFFNEFLKENLTEHRKVFEILGSKMKTDKTDNQLSGLGFSSTQKSHVFCKVIGSFTRTIKINF
ncbi:hypothetical protein KAR91_52595 [Candidatus Pacearchaeota archaeon]|nr:hypothetical protein [Candidatus Pacearchaeota archaeon]